MNSKGDPSPHQRRLLLLRSIMLLLLYATNIISAYSTSIKHITSSSSCAWRSSRAAAFVSLDNNLHPRRKELATRYLQSLTQLRSTSTHTSSSHLQNQDTNNTKNKQQQNNRRFDNINNINNPLILQSRINDLTSHPAVVWDESSTFASMQKKKLSRRHLHLFDRRTDNGTINNNTTSVLEDDDLYQDVLFDQFAKAVCDAGVVARKEV